MSFNYGATKSEPVTVTPSPPTMTLSPVSAAVTGVTNDFVDVPASLGNMTLSSLNAQIGNDVIARPDAGSMSMTPQATTIDYTPAQGDVDVDVPTANMMLTSINASVSAINATLEADWNARISGEGVVWYHDFRTDAEVNAFRVTGSDVDPNDTLSPPALQGKCIRQTADSVTGGGCLEITRPQGTGEVSSWWRPFSPMDTGSGKAVNDPGADGSIAVQTWNPNNASELRDHVNGWYGHPDLQDANFDGQVFYLQFRVKADPRRITGGNEAIGRGKFFWLTQAESGSSFEKPEHVFYSYGTGGNDGLKNYFAGYVFGVNGTDPLWQDDTDGFQPGTKWSTDWSYSGGWDTIQLVVKPGLVGGSGEDAFRLRAYAAHDGETEYTQIYDQQYAPDAITMQRGGLQALLLSTYSNLRNHPQDFWQRYDQIIFSKEWIPCPGSSQVTVPDWFTNANHLEAVAPLGNSIASVADPNAFSHGTGNITLFIDSWTGMGCDQDSKEIFMLANGGHNDYWGNEVYSCDLSVDNPVWVRRRDATWPNSNNNDSVLSDGRPSSSHTSGHQTCAEGRWFLLGMTAFVPNGFSDYQQWFEYTPSRGKENRHRSSIGNNIDDWINLGGNHPNTGSGAFGYAIYDPRDRQVITGTAKQTQCLTFTSIDDMTDPNGVLQNSYYWDGNEAALALDPENRFVILYGSEPGWRYQPVDTDAEKQGTTFAIPSVTGTPPPRKSLLSWHAPSGAFLTWDGFTAGQRQILFKGTPTIVGRSITALNWTTHSISGLTLPASPDSSRDMWDRTQFIEDMGNGESAIIIVPEYGNPDTYAIPIKAAV